MPQSSTVKTDSSFCEIYYVYQKPLSPGKKMVILYNQIQRRQAAEKFHKKQFTRTVQANLMFTSAAKISMYQSLLLVRFVDLSINENSPLTEMTFR